MDSLRRMSISQSIVINCWKIQRIESLSGADSRPGHPRPRSSVLQSCEILNISVCKGYLLEKLWVGDTQVRKRNLTLSSRFSLSYSKCIYPLLCKCRTYDNLYLMWFIIDVVYIKYIDFFQLTELDKPLVDSNGTRLDKFFSFLCS
jgi:hypothetical protein